jgi:hypothetical protein
MEIEKATLDFLCGPLAASVSTFVVTNIVYLIVYLIVYFFKIKLDSKSKRADAVESIRFATFHKESASVIAETYSLLGSLFSTVQDYTQFHEHWGFEHHEPTLEKLKEQRNSLFRYFYQKQIFLPKEAVQLIEAFDQALIPAIGKFRENCSSETNPATKEDWDPVQRAVNTELPEILKKLEDRFRELLGSS